MLLQNLIFRPYQTRPNLTKLLLKYMHWFGIRDGSSLDPTRLARLDTIAKQGPGSTRSARNPEILILNRLDTSKIWLELGSFCRKNMIVFPSKSSIFGVCSKTNHKYLSYQFLLSEIASIFVYIERLLNFLLFWWYHEKLRNFF